MHTLKPRILIADDDAALLQALSLRLRHAGYEVITALDGYNALARAVEKRPDLIVLDINMPAGDGFSVQDRIEKSTSSFDLPVIYITGETSDRVARLASHVDAAGLFHKPIDTRKLLEAIEQAILARAA